MYVCISVTLLECNYSYMTSRTLVKVAKISVVRCASIALDYIRSFWLHSSSCCKGAHSFIFLITSVDFGSRVMAVVNTAFHTKPSSPQCSSLVSQATPSNHETMLTVQVKATCSLALSPMCSCFSYIKTKRSSHTTERWNNVMHTRASNLRLLALIS